MSISLTRIQQAARPFRALPLFAYLAVWQQRRALTRLSTANLRDMGISPAEAAREAARPFWDLPPHHRQ